jgi:hypothetical protein
MTILIRMYLLRKPLVLIVFLFVFAAAHSEMPEHSGLKENTSNDFVISACGRQPVQASSVSQEVASTLEIDPAEAVRAQTVQDLRFSPPEIPAHLSGQDRLFCFSIQRT